MVRDEAVRLTPTSAIANFILVVEDDEEEAAFLKDFLEKRKFRVTIAKDGGQAQATFVMRKPDLVILDLILPGESGFEVCVRMKQANSTIPVLVLSAIDLADARALAERVGADDYLTKPFALEELVARLQALLRRPGALLGRSLRVGNIAFDTEARQVFVGEAAQFFSAREVAVLEILMRRSGRVVSKKLVEDQLFGLSIDVGSNAVEVYVHRLRKQLADSGATAQIHTIRGVGYLIAEDKGP